MKRAREVLISRGALAGIHAASLTSSERSQKKKRLRSCAVSSRIQRARGCWLNKNVEACDMVVRFAPGRQVWWIRQADSLHALHCKARCLSARPMQRAPREFFARLKGIAKCDRDHCCI